MNINRREWIKRVLCALLRWIMTVLPRITRMGTDREKIILSKKLIAEKMRRWFCLVTKERRGHKGGPFLFLRSMRSLVANHDYFTADCADGYGFWKTFLIKKLSAKIGEIRGGMSLLRDFAAGFVLRIMRSLAANRLRKIGVLPRIARMGTDFEKHF